MMAHRRNKRWSGAVLAAAGLGAIAVAWLSFEGIRTVSRSAPSLSMSPQGTLTPEQDHDLAIAPGQGHAYQFDVPAGVVLDLQLQQHNIDLVLHLYPPAAAEPLVVDTLTGSNSLEEVRIAAAAAAEEGSWRLEVLPNPGELADGRYQLRLRTLPATAENTHRAAADRAFYRATELEERQDSDAAQIRALSREAVEQAVRTGDRQFQATVLERAGRFAARQNDPTPALEDLTRSQQLFRDLGNDIKVATLYNHIGDAQRRLGNTDAALAAHRAALEIFQRHQHALGIATTTQNLGLVFEARGELEAALDSYHQAAESWPASQAPDSRLYDQGRIAALLLDLGRPEEATEALEPLRDLLAQPTTARTQATAWVYLGRVESGLGHPAQALEALQHAVEMWSTLNDRNAVPAARLALANAQLRAGHWAEGQSSYRQAADEYAQLGNTTEQAMALAGMAWCQDHLDQGAAALASYDQARELAAKVDQDGIEASALLGKARALRRLGRMAPAQETSAAALALVEQQRTRYDSLRLRSDFLSTKHDYYQLQADLLMTLHAADPGAGFDLRALATGEHGRARSLLDSLRAARANPGADPTLGQEARELVEQLNALDRQRATLLQQPSGSGELAAVESRQRRLLGRYDAVNARLQAADPIYRAITRSDDLSLDAMRRLLGADTLLVVYSLGEERSWLWWLAAAGPVHSAELPPREEIEELARDLHHNLGFDHPQTAGQAASAAAELSRLLLAPLAAQLDHQRLAVVADGALQLVPFAALPDPAAADGTTPLLARHEVVHLPSVAVLSALRERRGKPRAGHSLALLAGDPVFSLTDPRLAATTPAPAAPATTDSLLTRSARSAGLESFPRLGHTGDEVLAIRSLLPRDQVTTLTGFAASRQAILNRHLERYRILHFATHGLLDPQYPELSGLVLSLVDEQGNPQDGFLRAYEIYQLHLDADLVVLSACRTGLGREVRGEGLVGLPQAFLYAGASGVLVSLWPINDRSTAELMTRFYSALLRDHMSPPAALREAQEALRRSSEWSSPYHWAGFVFTGDWLPHHPGAGQEPAS